MTQPNPTPDDTRERLGQLIRKMRLDRGETEKQLGAILGRTHAAFSDIELGKTNLTVKDLSVIANHFGVSMVSMIQAIYLAPQPEAHHCDQVDCWMKHTQSATQPEHLSSVSGKATNTFISESEGDLSGQPEAAEADISLSPEQKEVTVKITDTFKKQAPKIEPQPEAVQQLIADLKACNSGDPEADHGDADDLLLDYINDPQVTEAYSAINKWYA